MVRKVTVGPKIQQNKDVVANVEYDDVQNPTGPSVHIKVVLPSIDGETEEDFTKRAAEAAKRIVDKMSEEIESGSYAKRS